LLGAVMITEILSGTALSRIPMMVVVLPPPTTNISMVCFPEDYEDHV
jgi:hypothetical protein